MARNGKALRNTGNESLRQSEGFQGRVPPHSLEAERSVLGAILLDNQAYVSVSDVLRGDDFYHEAHKTIYAAMQGLFEGSKPIDELTVADSLNTMGELERIGGESYISDLLRYVVSARNVATHARIVRTKAETRRLIQAGIHIASMGYEEPEFGEYLEDAEKQIFDVAVDKTSKSFYSLKEVSAELMEEISSRNNSEDEYLGVETGFPTLDKMLGGFQKSDLIIVAARPAMGKTSFVLNCALNAGRKLHQRGKTDNVVVFSLEMGKLQLASRLICSHAGIDVSRLRTGKGSQPLSPEEWMEFMNSINELSSYPVVLDDSSLVTLETIKSHCRKLKMEEGLAMVVIDYLQLMEMPKGSRNESRAVQLGEVSRGLKMMARELDVPVIALSQLNRELEKRPDKRPMLPDLRESGAIEQDADIIMFIYRDAVYQADPESLPVEKQMEAELIIAKHRNGETGKIHMQFRKEYTRFEEPSYIYRDDENQ